MLGFFTDPYAEELLFGTCSRFHNHIQYHSQRNTMLDLFGTDSITAVVDLPGHLDALVARLPENSPYTADYLIQYHTLFPFYAPFCPPERLIQVRTDMRYGNSKTIHVRLGIMASALQRPEFIQYCPLCYGEDELEIGESYLHRLPQLPGIKVCPLHKVWLENTAILVSRDDSPYAFISALDTIQPTEPCYINVSDPDQRVLLAIAEDAAWLLEQVGLVEGPEKIRSRYLALLVERDFATYSGRVHMTKLVKAFKAFYSPELLKTLGYPIEEHIEEHWLCRLIRNKNAFFSPIQHLLLIHFLDHTAKTFFNYLPQQQVFGGGPWPCLNKVCEHYDQPWIAHYTLSYDTADGRPVGLFSCSICGFTYQRKGPDKLSDDHLKFGRIISFGDVWINKLRQLYSDSTISLREKARILGVDPRTVKRQFEKLTLPIHANQNDRQRETTDKFGLDKCKQQWLTLMKDNPGAGVTELRSRIPKVYMCLYRHERNWLRQHTPISQQNSKAHRPRIDWDKRDQELALKVPDAVIAIKAKQAPFQRVTVASIGRKLGQLARIQKQPNSLPLTMQCIARAVETRIDFALRRIIQVSDGVAQQGGVLQRWELMKAAGVERLVSLPVICEALDNALKVLKTTRS